MIFGREGGGVISKQNIHPRRTVIVIFDSSPDETHNQIEVSHLDLRIHFCPIPLMAFCFNTSFYMHNILSRYIGLSTENCFKNY